MFFSDNYVEQINVTSALLAATIANYRVSSCIDLSEHHKLTVMLQLWCRNSNNKSVIINNIEKESVIRLAAFFSSLLHLL